ncbi:MAG: zinc-dependent alcohol dehydrogenase family protein [Clostridia bacterium]|nr:zinc-dependent alcohol dehydrogenase family protein [Clostridia bacterium]
MKAAVFYKKEDLRIEDREIPKAYGDKVLVKIKACGICGTDMHIFDGDEGAAPTPAGTTLGHEFAGEVVEVGEMVNGIKVGDKVCVDPNKLCNECSFCKDGVGHFCENMIGIGTTVDGGFAEYCLVPMSQVYKFEKDISFAEAAMTEPVACCLHGIDMCNINCGDTVLVIGGGMIGLIMLQLASLKGAANLILVEPIKEKRDHALKLGADIVIDPINENVSDVLAQNNITRINTVIECVGKTATIEQAISLAGKYSTVMMFGLTRPNDEIKIKPFEIFKKEIVLKASFIHPYTQSRALKLIENKKVDVSSMIYKMISVDELPSVLADKKERAKGKYIVSFE